MGYPTPQAKTHPTPQQKGQLERAEALTGYGGAAPEKKAVTREDLAALGAVKLKALRVSAAPTADDFNALVDDMRAIANLLNSMGAKFTGL